VERSEYLSNIQRIAEDIKEAAARKPRPQLRLVTEGVPYVPPPAQPAALEQTPRARAIRRIEEIAESRGWQREVTRTLDRHEAAYLCDLEDEVVLALRDRMEYFEDCVQTCCDPDDAPPAR
jgi:hypothetical protein